MAFVETWDETAPDGSAITVSQLDDHQRSHKIAVRERLEGDPADANTGIFQSSSFASAPKLKQLRGHVGAVSNVGYGFDGFADDGIYHPADDQVGVVCGGTEYIRFTNAGIVFNANTTVVAGSIGKTAAAGVLLRGVVGSVTDFLLESGTGVDIIRIPTGTNDVELTPSGVVRLRASATNGPGIRLPHGVAPTSPTNGDLWTTTSGLFGRINGTTRQYATLAGTETLSSKTIASPTVSGTLTLSTGDLVANNLTIDRSASSLLFTGNGSAASGSITRTSTEGLYIAGVTGTAYDLVLANNGGTVAVGIISSTQRVAFPGSIEIGSTPTSAGSVRLASQGSIRARNAANNGDVIALQVNASDVILVGNSSHSMEIQTGGNALGFFGATPVTRPTVTGSRGGNAALQDLLTELANLGLITDSTT